MLPGGLSSGFEYPELRWAVITTAKGGSTTAAKSRRKARRQQGEVLRELTDLTPRHGRGPCGARHRHF
ncbi:MAG: hypothetical protein ACLTY5_03375 [Angelakisella sp.]